jgi:uncharacterized protein (DUF433 family)
VTQAICLRSPGSLRQLDSGGRKVVKMRVIRDSITREEETLTSGGSGGNVTATDHPQLAPAEPFSVVRKTAGVLGGDARIRDTRIAVWMLVLARQLGMTDEEIRNSYRPPLYESDLEAAWRYYDANKGEVDLAITENEAD